MYDYKKMGLLPYQIAYIADRSQIKIYEKSRRIGITYVQALEDVIDCGVEGLYDVWFCSNNDLNAREYMRYCLQFCRVFSAIVKDLSGTDFTKDAKIYSIEFTNGKRITGLSSSPEQLHGKGGKIVLDEFARRADDRDVWEAAAPASLIWKNPLRIISTHNGKHCLFYKFLQDVEAGKLAWSHHRTTIADAVAAGLADRVLQTETTPMQREEYLNSLRANVANPQVWAQQFMCQPQDESETFLPYPLLEQNAKADLLPFKELQGLGTLYAGLDVGRFKNLTVFWVVEKISAARLITRHIRTIQNQDFPKQEQILSAYLKLPNLRRLCIDKTGLGIGLTDYLQKTFGKSKAEGVTLTAAHKELLAFRLQKHLMDGALDLPDDAAILSDLNSVKQDTTAAGNIRLRAATNEDSGSHADYFWAAALALEAAAATPYVSPQLIVPKTYMTASFKRLLKGFKKD